MNEAIKHYEAALKAAFPQGASSDVFEHWNKARQAIAEAEREEIPRMRIDASAPIVMMPHPAFAKQHPKREWIGLTDFDRLHLKTNYSRLTPIYHDKQKDTDVVADIVDKDALINAIEAKLKEKNFTNLYSQSLDNHQVTK